MLRTILRAQTGWCFVNDPTRSNNSVGRDTAWFGYGADYVVPEIARDALLAYVDLQEPSGMIVEYYDIRTNETADYGLNINDNTPLLILALLHHYHTSGDRDFLRRVYPAAVRAARYILSQRDAAGDSSGVRRRKPRTGASSAGATSLRTTGFPVRRRS